MSLATFQVINVVSIPAFHRPSDDIVGHANGEDRAL
jgi:hypothetical protein